MVNLFHGDPPPKQAQQRAESVSDETVKAIYALYPKKVGRKPALAAIRRALRDLVKERCDDPVGLLMDAVREYRDAVGTWPEAEKQYIPMPTTWFNGGRWEDDRNEWYKGERKRPAPTGKILSGWEDRLKAAINAVQQAPSERDKWRSQAELATLIGKLTPRLRGEPTIAAIVEHAEALL